MIPIYHEVLALLWVGVRKQKERSEKARRGRQAEDSFAKFDTLLVTVCFLVL